MASIEVEPQVIQGAISTPAAATPRKMQYWSWWLAAFAVVWVIVYFTAFPNPFGLLQQNWPLFLVGFAGATLGNATAVGGGLVFVPVMIFVYHLAPVTALSLALGTQSFGMSSGALGWLRRGAVALNALSITVPAMLAGSLISSLIIRPNALLVKGLFGPVSIFIGLITLYLLKKHGESSQIPPAANWPLGLFAFIGGLITGWVAIGVGEVIAASLMLAYGLRPERSIGLGVVLLAIDSLFLTIIHHYWLGGVPWAMVIFTGFGAVFGGRMGPYLSQWIGPRRLKLSFAVVAILDGCIFVLQFFLSHKV
jgi:uncharacterized membrane protein YfcA